MNRTIIVGGPRCGKSTLAAQLAAADPAIAIYCGDPESKVKEPLFGVEYLPEDIQFSGDDGAADWIARHWFTMPGPWVMEGHVMARALARWLSNARPDDSGDELWPYTRPPCDRIIVLSHQYEHAVTKPGQRAMAKGVQTTWNRIKHHFTEITEERQGNG